MPKHLAIEELIAATLASVMLGALAFGVPAHAGDPDDGSAATVTADDRADSVSALGRIEPEHGVIVLAVASTPEAVSGAVVSTLLVEAGDRVTKGQLLAETDAARVEEASIAVARAELEVAQRKAEMAVGREQDACSRADVAERTAARATHLLKSGATSSEEADVAAGDARARSGSCSSARIATKAAASAIAVAQAGLDRAQIAMERCRLRAPTDGRVLRIIKRPGEFVDEEGILEMGQVDRMYAIAEVYETDIGRVRVGQKATVTSKALDGPLSGVVERVRLEVRKQDTTGTDPASRKDARIVEVEVLLDQPEAVASLTNLQVEVLIHP